MPFQIGIAYYPLVLNLLAILSIVKLNNKRCTLIHKFNSKLEFVKDDWLIDMSFRYRSYFKYTFSNNTKITFMTEDKLVDIRTWTNPRCLLNFLNSPNWSCNLNSDYDVINISIFVLFHTWSSSTNPSTKWGELYRIRFMSTADSELR